MSDKKNIDRLFQEKLKDFEAIPNNSVWDNISTELRSSKKRKKRFPIWWRVAGVAAGLLLLFTLSQLILNNNTIVSTQETIVDVDSKKDTINNASLNITKKGNNVADQENLSEEFKSKSSNNSVLNKFTTPSQNDDSANKSRNVTVNVDNQNDNTSNINKLELVVSSGETKNVIAENNNSNLPQEKLKNNSIDKAKADAILNNDNATVKTTGIEKTQESALASTNENVENKDEIGKEKPNSIIEGEKLSLTEEVAANEEENVEYITEEKFKRWKAASNIAPVYFNTLGKGSSIHPQFNNNSKTGNINLSYGISGSYAINKKLSVRTGVNKVNLGYSTNDVVVFNNIGASTGTQLLRNVALNESGQNLSFISVDEFNFVQVPDLLNNVINSSIDQKLGFIEIPFELEYKLSSKKIDINIIGGFSALFLNNNEVYSVLDGNSTLLGKATNINNTSFSANFGLGFDFKLTDKFNLNLEPVFKYQLNTFNSTSGNFKPYFIGVYSGLSFKF
jgi:hypothetical protein